MYTSQEGELYLGQARALGAVGVVSKGAGGADVQAALRDLWPAAPAPVPDIAPMPAEPAAQGAPSMLPATPAAPVIELHQVREEFALLREQVSTALAAQASSAAEQMRTLLREARAAAQAPLAQTPDKPRHSPIPWLLALAAGIAAAVFGTLQWQNGEQLRLLRAELADSRAAVALLTARLTLPPEVEAPVVAEEVPEPPAPQPAAAARRAPAPVAPASPASSPVSAPDEMPAAASAPLTVPAATHIPE
jgi:hypothetical protein